MTVGEAVEQLLEFPLESELAICGHEVAEGMGWTITHFTALDENMVLIEGVGPVAPLDRE